MLNTVSRYAAHFVDVINIMTDKLLPRKYQIVCNWIVDASSTFIFNFFTFMTNFSFYFLNLIIISNINAYIIIIFLTIKLLSIENNKIAFCMIFKKKFKNSLNFLI